MSRNQTEFKLASPRDFEVVQTFYWDLIDLMKDQSDVIGWKKGIYPTDDYLKESLGLGELYILTDNDAIVGSVIYNHRGNEGYAGIPWSVNLNAEEYSIPHALGISPLVQGKGYGKILVNELIRLSRERGEKAIRLDLLKGNTAAERLYTSMGFHFVLEKTMFYEDTGWTAYCMYELVL